MTPFLYQVARHYLQEGISDRCLVFPNRRSIVFFTKHLRTLVAARGTAPLIEPQMLTVADFFGRLYGRPVADKVSLLLELYDVYKGLYPTAEPLDDFIFWGDVILSDFSDVDKYLVDPQQLFTNVADFKSIEDTYEYLSPEQREAIEQFLSHFRGMPGHDVMAGSDRPSYKAKFLGLWNILLPLYRQYNELLTAKGMAYDGMMYRSVAEAFKAGSAPDITAAAFPRSKSFVFVGLNALNECERLVMKRLRDARMAEFCWDYCGEMIRDKSNRSSFFMEDNVAVFPMTWKLEPLDGVPQVNVVAVPSAAGQAKLLPEMLGAPEDTAIVIPDENMLLPVLNSIPDSVGEVNVTMGLPLQGSRIHALMHEVTMLQLHLRQTGGKWYFYHKYVWNILSGGLVKLVLTDQEKEAVQKLKSAANYYVPQEDFADCGPILQQIFRPVVKDPKAASASGIKDFSDYLEGVLRILAPKMLEDKDLAAEVEFAWRWLSCVLRLKGKDLAVMPATYVRLLGQLLAVQSVPLEGEPLAGLQIMGPLETRALDFGTVILLSCNEGVFPRHNVSASFVPPQLRKAFGLPTYEFQDAIWAYYFYRMICRAGKVWLLYDTRTEGIVTGEESRYIKQLRYHFRLPINTYTASADLHTVQEEQTIAKPDDMEARLKDHQLSASALQKYLACPAQFYYAYVLRLEPEEEVAESMDAGMFGDIYHGIMQKLYEVAPGKRLTVNYLQSVKKDKERIRAIADDQVKQKVHTIEVSGRNLVLEDIILEYVDKTLEIDLQLVKDKGDIQLLGLELPETWEFDGYKFYGRIDRLERLADGTVRVVDYKTGHTNSEDVNITDENAAAVADKLFGDDNSKRPKIALQLFLYDMLISRHIPSGTRVVNCIYPTQKLFTSGIEQAPLSQEFCDIMKERLSGLLKEIAGPGVPFVRTEDREHTCAYCDFKNICGR